MITSLDIENFKGIRERFRIDFRPLTLLFGANSAGKSTIVQSLHYLREVLESRNYDAQQTVSGGAFVDLGGFRNFVHNQDLRWPVTLKLELRHDERGEWFFVPEPPGVDTDEVQLDEALRDLDEKIGAIPELVKSVWLEVALSWSEDRQKPFVSSYSAAINGERTGTIHCRPDNDAFVGKVRLFGSHVELVEVNLDHPLLRVEDGSNLFARAWATRESNDSEPATRYVLRQPDALPALGYQLGLSGEFGPRVDWLLSMFLIGPGDAALRELQQYFRYLGPLRTVPSRSHAPIEPDEGERWADGQAAWDMLLHGNGWIRDRTNEWLADKGKLDVGYTVAVQEYGEMDLSAGALDSLVSGRRFHSVDELKKFLFADAIRREAVLIKKVGNIKLRPKDLGVGVSQLIPVVVAALALDHNLFAVEQPELHLHPRLQCSLGDLLIEGALGPHPKTVLIETHSEHLILRILRRVRESMRGEGHAGTLVRPEDVAVYYVDQEDGQAVPRTLRIDDQGEFVDRWPNGFFAEREEELF